MDEYRVSAPHHVQAGFGASSDGCVKPKRDKRSLSSRSSCPCSCCSCSHLWTSAAAFYTWLIVTNAAREGVRVCRYRDARGHDRHTNLRQLLQRSHPSNRSLTPGKLTITKTNVQGAAAARQSPSI